MATEISEKSLAKLEKMLAIMDEGTLTKTDFMHAFQKVIDTVLQIQKQQSEAINRLEEFYNELLKKTQTDNVSSLEQLKKQTNQLFVGDQLSRMDRETKESFGSLHQKIMDTIENKMQEINKNLSKMGQSEKNLKFTTENSTKTLVSTIEQKIKGLDGFMKNTVNEQSLQKLRTEIFDVIRKMPARKGMRKVPIIRAIDLSASVDGSATTFNLPRDTRRVLLAWSTQFPIVLRPTTDFTLSGNTLTIVSAQVGTFQSGQTLTCLIETFFYA